MTPSEVESTQISGCEKKDPLCMLVKRGETCPHCHVGVIDYNGLLDLECPICGYREGLGGGCT